MDHEGSFWDMRRKKLPDKYFDTLNKMPSKRFLKPEELAPLITTLCLEGGMASAGSLIILNGGAS